MDVVFRDYLHFFKGAPLAVFMAIALHCDKTGHASPGIKKLVQETGYDDTTISNAISKLTEMRINGHRVLARRQFKNKAGQFGAPDYCIFPTEEEAKHMDQAVDQAETPHPEKADTASEPHPGFPYPVNPGGSIVLESMDHDLPDSKLSGSQKPAGNVAPIGAGWDKFQIKVTKWYPVNHTSKKVLDMPLDKAEYPASKAAEWTQKEIALISGQELKRDLSVSGRYGQYDVLNIPQDEADSNKVAKAKPVFDAIAQAGFNLPKDGKAGKRTGARIGVMISELAAALGRSHSDVENDAVLAQKIRKFYAAWVANHPEGPQTGHKTKPVDSVAFTSKFLGWYNAQNGGTTSSVLQKMDVA